MVAPILGRSVRVIDRMSGRLQRLTSKGTAGFLSYEAADTKHGAMRLHRSSDSESSEILTRQIAGLRNLSDWPAAWFPATGRPSATFGRQHQDRTTDLPAKNPHRYGLGFAAHAGCRVVFFALTKPMMNAGNANPEDKP